MRTRTAAITVTAIALSTACTRHLDVINPSDLAGRHVSVDTGSGHSEPGTMSSDGMTVYTAHGDLRLDEVSSITDTRRVRGAFEGGAIVGLILAVPAAALAYSSGDDKCGEGICILPMTAGEKAGLAAGGFFMFGSVIGAVIGAIHGSHDVYDIGGASEVQPRFTPSGPPGSVAGMTVRF